MARLTAPIRAMIVSMVTLLAATLTASGVQGAVAMEVGASRRIDTMVVLMEENRAFDHMLGWMKRGGPQGDTRVDGLTGAECNAKDITKPLTGDNKVHIVLCGVCS